MRLLTVFLIAVSAPLSALANGAPCGSAPKLENAEAARAINSAVRADLGAGGVQEPFITRARQTVDDLAESYDLSRDQVIARYVFHICEALDARGTGSDQLSAVLSRIEQALKEPRQDNADKAGSAANAPDATEAKPLPEANQDAASENSAGAEATTPAPPAANESAPSAEDEQAAATEGASETGPSTAASDDAKAAARTDKAARDDAAAAQRHRRGQPQKRKFRANRNFQIRGNDGPRSYRVMPTRPQGNLGISQFAGPKNRGTAMGSRGPASVGGGGASAARPDVTKPPQTAQPKVEASPRAPVSSPEVSTAEETTASAETEAAPASRPEAAQTRQRSPGARQPTSESARSEATAEPRTLAPVMAEDSGPPAGEGGESETAAAEPATEPATTAPTIARETAPPAGEAGETQTAGDKTGPEGGTAAPADRAPETAGEQAQAQTATPAARADPAQAGCPERGVLGPECFDVDAALEQLRDRPVEYNHPQQMIKDQPTEITLVLRTDFTEEGLPEEASGAFENLQGDVKQQRAKIANIMSARLRGRDFEVDPKGMQERTVTWRRPVEWSWYVTPETGGEDKRLELELYAHIVNPQGETQPPVLIKTLDATIDVDVRTLDWLIEQAKTFEPIYAVAAAIIGLFTALLTLWVRRRPAHSGDGPPSGITTASAPPDRRISDMSASEAAAEAARKGQDDSRSNGRG